MNLQTTRTISGSLKFKAVFNGIISNGMVGFRLSELLYSTSSKQPMIARILVGSAFSTRPVMKSGRSFIRSTLSGAKSHLILLIEPECKTVIGMSPRS